MTELILSVLLAAFAVFGLYCLIHLCFDAASIPKGMQTALRIHTREEIREIPERLDAILSRLSAPRGTVFVLVPAVLYESQDDVPLLLGGAILGYDAEIVIYRED